MLPFKSKKRIYSTGKTLEFARLTGAMSEGISQNRSFLRLLEYEHHLSARRVQEAANQTFPISAWGFTIGATITKLYA
jgi:hypothetical protein